MLRTIAIFIIIYIDILLAFNKSYTKSLFKFLNADFAIYFDKKAIKIMNKTEELSVCCPSSRIEKYLLIQFFGTTQKGIFQALQSLIVSICNATPTNLKLPLTLKLI